MHDPRKTIKTAPWHAAVAASAGPTITAIGLGNLWRGGRGLVIGCVFIAIGGVLTAIGVRHLRNRARASGSTVGSLGLHVAMVAGTVVVGAAIYVGLLTVMDRG